MGMSFGSREDGGTKSENRKIGKVLREEKVLCVKGI